MGHRSPAVRHGGRVNPSFRVIGEVGATGNPCRGWRLRGARATHGFTLIEVMITVAVIAILAAVAIPNYSRHVVRSHRAAIESFMLEVSGAQERYLVDNRAYAANLGTLGMSVPAAQATRYDVAVTPNAALPPGYSIVATPKGSQVAGDADCGSLTLTSAGAKSASGSGTDCWN
ncbi:MAG: type IV pilin protein [Cupriavidus necator]